MSQSTDRLAPAPDRVRAPGQGPLRPFHFPPIERFTLSNGLPVITASTPGLPVATMSLLLGAGGLHEEPEKAGLASLTAGLLESGAGERTGAEIADALERLGAQFHVGTSWDASHLDVTGLTTRLPEAAAILTELVRAPTFPEGEVDRLRQEQLHHLCPKKYPEVVSGVFL